MHLLLIIHLLMIDEMYRDDFLLTIDVDYPDIPFVLIVIELYLLYFEHFQLLKKGLYYYQILFEYHLHELVNLVVDDDLYRLKNK